MRGVRRVSPRGDECIVIAGRFVVQSIVPHVVVSLAVTGMSIVWPKQTGLFASSLALVLQIWTETTAVSVHEGVWSLPMR